MLKIWGFLQAGEILVQRGRASSATATGVASMGVSATLCDRSTLWHQAHYVGVGLAPPVL